LDTLEAPPGVKDYILNNKRGAGYWIWKPYVIKQILNISNPGDIVIYVDSSTYFKGTLQPIVDFINKNSILAFKHSDYHNQATWTKMSAVNYYGYPKDWCKTDGIFVQFMAAFTGIRNDYIGNKLLDLYLEVMIPENTLLFDDTPVEGNCESFKESRHDQQMLSLILYKYFNYVEYPVYNKNEYNWVWHENINGKNRHD
jgi:hypothetical protein